MKVDKPILIISILGVLLSVLLSGVYFQFSYFEPDTVSYLFQAKLFADGKISVPAPPEHGFSSSPHINILNGKWYSKYPFGNALMLVFGVFINAPWIIPALAMGGTLFLLYHIVTEMHGKSVALIAAVIGLISPATLGMGSTWFSEPVSCFYLSLHLFTLLRTLNGKGGIGYPLLSGFALGYAFNTRPLSAIVFGIVSAGLTLYRLLVACRRGKNDELDVTPAPSRLVVRLGLFFIPFLAMVGVCLAWNTHFTEEPFTFTHTVAQPYDKIGFGKRTEGYEPALENASIFTPAWAIERTWRHILPCISFNALGWGSYHPMLLKEVNLSLGWFIAFVPLMIPWGLVFVPFFHVSRHRYDWFCLALLLGNLLLYAFFYFEGSTWGFTPVNARYYTESTLLGFIPLVARGMVLVYGKLKRLMQPSDKNFLQPITLAVSVLLLLLSVNTVWSYVRIGKVYQNWSPIYQKLPSIVDEQNIHNAVIFISASRDAPIGDYPFQKLDEADIVYFKLGPSKQWKLTNSDWKAVYKQYFTGRDAYLYVPRDNRLKALSVNP